MSKFGYLKKLQVAEKPVDLRLVDLPGEPVLHVLSATEANRKFWRELLARRPNDVGRGKRFTAEAIARDRDEDRDLYPGRVVVGWTGIVGEDGKPVPFSVADCTEFLAALPDDLFDEIRAFCTKASHFRESTFDVEEAAKN